MKSGLKIFVVDDEPVIASTRTMILRQFGFEVESFTVPMEALEAAKLGPPNILISDVTMPGLTGVNLAIAIHELCPGCKILLVSGQAATSDLLKDSRSKGYNFTLLQKPLHPTELLSALRAIA